MKNSSPRTILALTCLIFLALGVLTAALGPVLPELAEQTGTDLAAAGTIFTGMFLGALLSHLVSGPLVDKIGHRVVVVVGLVLLAGGVLALTGSRALPLTLALTFVAGLGHGAVDLGANLWIASAYRDRSVAALNLLNFFFGVGAFAGPLLASLFLRRVDTGLPALWVSAGMLAAALPLVLLVRGGNRPAEQAAATGATGRRIYGSALLWGLGAIVLLYVGFENGMGGWTTIYVQKTLAMTIETAALVTAGFWLALTAGRMVSAGVGLRVAPERLLLASLAGALGGGLLLAGGMGSLPLTAAGVFLVGFFFGPVYPTMMAITTAAFPAGPGKAVSVVSALGSVGGMSVPWLQGVILNGLGPAASAAFTLSGALAMLALAAGILLRRPRVEAPAETSRACTATEAR